MRKLIFLIAAAVMMILAASCGQPSASIKFNTIEVEDLMKHPNAEDNETGLNYVISFTYPSEYSDKAVLKTLQRDFISHVLGEKYVSLTPEKAISALIEDWKQEYINEMEEFLSETGFVLPYEYRISNAIILSTDQLLQSQAEGYWYMGGAHGVGRSWAALFNLKTGQEYSRNDIFDDRKNNDIYQLLYREIYAIAEGDDINHDEIWTEDVGFAVMPDSIVFLYHDYALGSYALGIREVFIPYAQIFSYLREGTPVWELAKEKSKN